MSAATASTMPSLPSSLAAATALLLIGCSPPLSPDAPPPGLAARVAGFLGPVAEAPLAVRVTSTTTRAGFVERTLELPMGEGVFAPATRLGPSGPGVRPGLLLLHGHDARGRWWMGASAGRLAERLAEAGYDVLLPDLRSFGGFDPGGRGHYGAEGWAQQLEASGDRYARVAANDARRWLAVLRAAPRVGRIAVAGHSLGAWLALLVAAAEPDVETLMSSGLFLPFDVLFSDAHHRCQHLPGLSALGDAPGFAARIAERARVQIHWGEADPLFPEGGPEALAALRETAADAIAAGRLEIRRTPGLGHALEPEAHLRFFERALPE